MVHRVETIIQNGGATSDTSAAMNGPNCLQFRADVEAGDRGQRDRRTALLRDRLHFK